MSALTISKMKKRVHNHRTFFLQENNFLQNLRQNFPAMFLQLIPTVVRHGHGWVYTSELCMYILKGSDDSYMTSSKDSLELSYPA
jgi:hypothetical protein